MSKQSLNHELLQAFTTAKGSTALVPTKRCFLVHGYYTQPPEDEGYFESNRPKWTDEWAVVELEAFEADEESFWHFFNWDPSAWERDLLVWATADPSSALTLAQSALAGDSNGHTTIANHAAFIAIVQKHALEASLPADLTFGIRESRRI